MAGLTRSRLSLLTVRLAGLLLVGAGTLKLGGD